MQIEIWEKKFLTNYLEIMKFDFKTKKINYLILNDKKKETNRKPYI